MLEAMVVVAVVAEDEAVEEEGKKFPSKFMEIIIKFNQISVFTCNLPCK